MKIGKILLLDFILKPIGLEDLLNAVNKAKASKANRDLQQQLSVLKESFDSLSVPNKKIVLKDSESIYFVKVSDIIHCKAEGPYTEFYLSSGQKIIISKSLKEYEELLEPFGFVRTHHSHLINIKRIVRFDKADGGTLILENDHEIPVSQRKREQILEMLNKL